MTYFETLSIVIFYLKYTDQLNVHGIAIVLPLGIGIIWRIVKDAYTLALIDVANKRK